VPNDSGTFESLVQSIVYQQLRGKTAELIHGRVLALFDGEKNLTPERLLKIPRAKLRGAGLSANKYLAVRDLAKKCLSGVVAPRKELEALPDAEIIARLTSVRGIGEWTVQMFLMFKLGRPDVLPTGDYGVRKAFGLMYRKNGRLPPPSVLEKHGEIWAPYRSVASWYLWRRLDMKALTITAFLFAACSKPAEPVKPAEPAPATPAAVAAPAVEQSEKDKALANPYPNDLGPATLPEATLASYPADLRKGYELMITRCAQCHTPSRPLNSRFDDSDTWNRYVKRMMNKPGCNIAKAEGKAIWQFLSYDSDKRKKGANAESWMALRSKLVAEFQTKHPARYAELKAANDL